ncbi:hypothetical protein Agabi119p4_320 [Agaricus bisporus var. burnettii]|uniref:H/ACA ribonucleoprotein complex non-core subunit NAF1 n=1 Tax=Agaricus bisporus var. burnettii TaxID=192524 RepID=A0A8H7FAA9_AGABI|nr:hypothetical protein Agabi119p4_320 [Agaricus bisporus var. burnettii]
MTTFKAPQSLPQDLLLISEFVDVPQQRSQLPASQKNDSEDDIASSSSDSEEEIEKDLTAPLEDESDASPSDSSLSSDSSDSEPEGEAGKSQPVPQQKVSTPDFDEDDTGPSSATTLPQTKNEVVDSIITIPELEEVGKDEELEKVGDVMSLIDNVVIVRGSPSEYFNRGSEKALDSDTLLVFEDRKVMGYIYETFGPTSQPFYQVKFNQAYPLDPEKVKIGRGVFHIPRRSHFVFVNQLKHFRGSDASNLHDEEPAEDEVEFSDDEAEAEHRRRLKRKRNDGRARSMSSSRRSTPVPSQLRDQDMMNELWNKNASDDKGPIDYGAGPSRPAPQPYDDPYSNAYDPVEPEKSAGSPKDHSRPQIEQSRPSTYRGGRPPRGRGRGRGRRYSTDSDRISGRGTGPLPQLSPSGMKLEEYDPRMPHEAPPSLYPQDPSWVYPPTQGFNQFHNQPYMFPGLPYQQTYASPSAFVQPHINPRFASAFGLQMSPTVPPYEPATSAYAQGPTAPVESLVTSSEQSLSGQWSTPMTEYTAPNDEGQRPAPTLNPAIAKHEERKI